MTNSKKLPKISIITPTYNSQDYIEDAIQSVINQNYPNFEHIVVDGGSTDGTLGILKNYTHLKWVSESDDGQSDALTKGFSMATGDIFGWLNSDDTYEPGIFSKVAEALSGGQFDGIYANYYFTDEHLNITRKIYTHPPVRWLSLFHCYVPSTTFFFKRKLWEEGVRIDKDFHICMDKEFFAQILMRGYNLKYINDFFAKFRWHGTNKSTDTKEVQQYRYREGLIIFNRYSRFFLPENKFSIYIYKTLVRFLLIYRKLLKLIS